MRVGRLDLTLLDPGLFAAKMGMLVVFTGLFLPLKVWDLRLPLLAYTTFVLALHVWLVAIYVWKVRWRLLWLHRTVFAFRLASVAFFIFLLARLEAGAGLWELVGFLSFSLALHTGLLLVLMVRVEPAPRAHPSGVG